jgi:hypothetical protein
MGMARSHLPACQSSDRNREQQRVMDDAFGAACAAEKRCEQGCVVAVTTLEPERPLWSVSLHLHTVHLHPGAQTSVCLPGRRQAFASLHPGLPGPRSLPTLISMRLLLSWPPLVVAFCMLTCCTLLINVRWITSRLPTICTSKSRDWQRLSLIVIVFSSNILFLRCTY